MINWFNHMYPYGNLHELNLDWVIATVKNGEKEIADFIGINTIKYADPILWNIESQYEANTVVVDGQTGNAYISVKAVPSGVHLSREEYWTQIYNYADVVDTLREQIAYNEGESTTATRPYSIDNLVFVNGILYRVIAPMIAGDSFVADSNVVQTTINAEILRLHGFITDEVSSRQSADTTLQGNIDAEASARQSADTTLQGNINTEASARQSADTTLQANIEAEASARQSADTTLQGNIDAEASARVILANNIGTLASLQTTSKDNLVDAINETLNVANSNKSMLDGKTIQIFGDSLSDENATNLSPNWVVKLRDKLPNTIINNNSVTGRKMVDLPNILYNINSFTADIVIVYLGTNDFGSNIPFGDWTTGNVNNEFCASLVYILNQIATKNTKKCQVYFITPPCRSDMYVNTLGYTLEMYRASIRGFCKGYGCNFINGENIPFLNRFYAENYYNNDMVHPNYTMSDIVCNYFINGLLSNGDSFGGSPGNINSISLDTTYFSGSLLFGLIGEELFIKGKITPVQSISGIVPITININEMLDEVYGAITPIFNTGNYYDSNGSQQFTTYFDSTTNKLMLASVSSIAQSTELFINYKMSPAWCNIGTTE